jgi:hypothetical protein
MSQTSSLQQQFQELVGQLAQLGPMRRGSVAHRKLPYHRKDGSQGRRGPYCVYTFKQDGKTKSRYLASPEEEELFRAQIERFRSFQKISRRLVETSQALAELETDARRGKKNSSAKSKRKAKGKSRS